MRNHQLIIDSKKVVQPNEYKRPHTTGTINKTRPNKNEQTKQGQMNHPTKITRITQACPQRRTHARATISANKDKEQETEINQDKTRH